MNKEKVDISQVKIKDYTMIIHISMDKVHLAKHQGIIVCEDNSFLNGKVVFQETSTPKSKNGNFRKSSTCYYLQGEKTPEFKNMKDLITYYYKFSQPLNLNQS